MSSPSKRREIVLMKLMMSDYKVEMVNDEMQEFYVHFHGPLDSPYYGGLWRVRVILPDAYPYKSLSIDFGNKMYHPNVDEIFSECVRIFLPQLLLCQNPSDPLNGEAAALMMRDRSAYDLRVKEYCEKYAKPDAIGGTDTDKHSSDGEISEDEYDSHDEEMVGEADP